LIPTYCEIRWLPLESPPCFLRRNTWHQYSPFAHRNARFTKLCKLANVRARLDWYNKQAGKGFSSQGCKTILHPVVGRYILELWNPERCAQQRCVPAETGIFMSEPFRPYEKLVDITILGKKFQVPERNSLLRCFQFLSPETIPYGRFCWNQDCQYCRVSCQLPDDDESREMLACKFIVMAGMEVNELSQELKWCLRAKLPQDETVIQP